MEDGYQQYLPKMAENSSKAEIRKFRKKLRQIEHLERLERELTDEEEEKVDKKSEIRAALKKFLKQRELDQKADNLAETMEKSCSTMTEEARSSVGSGESENDQQQVPAILTTDGQNTVPVNERSNLEPQKHSEHQPRNNTKNAVNSESTIAPEQISARSSEEGIHTLSSQSQVTGRSASSSDASTSGMRATKRQPTSVPAGNTQWENGKFVVRCLGGHNDLVASVDMDGSLLVSGSRDTMLKVWDCESGKELRSMGGHTGGITSVVLIKKDETADEKTSHDGYLSVTGSHDCSIKIWSLGDGSTLRSIYAYSPVICLDRWKGRLVSGSESGKVELWDLEAGENIRSARSGDDPVTCIQFQDDRIVSGSSAGVMKIWDVRQRALVEAVSSDTLDSPLVKTRRIHCLATTENEVYWGDDGTNIKVLDIRAGKVRKLKNHLTEFGSTSAMVIQDSLLISSGYDLDKGTGYLNVRSLPSEDYLATLDDDVTSYISCLCSGGITKDGTMCQRLCTGGSELKIWDQMAKNKVRKRPRADDSPSISCKHLRRYATTDNIDTESSDESDDERRDESSDDDDDNEGTTSNARQSWCTIS